MASKSPESRHSAWAQRGSRPPPIPSTVPVTNLPESSAEPAPQGTSGANVLALSQRQHEIILKAAQELKLIR